MKSPFMPKRQSALGGATTTATTTCTTAALAATPRCTPQRSGRSHMASASVAAVTASPPRSIILAVLMSDSNSPDFPNVTKISHVIQVTDGQAQQAAEDSEAFLLHRGCTQRPDETAWDYLDRVRADVDAVLKDGLQRAIDSATGGKR